MNATASKVTALAAAIAVIYPLSGGLVIWAVEYGVIPESFFDNGAVSFALDAYAAPLVWLYSNLPAYEVYIDHCAGW